MSVTPANAFVDWLQTYVTLTGYTLSRGMWVESSTNTGKRFVAVWIDGGRTPNLVQYPQIRLVVAGIRDGRSVAGETPAVEQFAHDIMLSSLENFKTDCLALVRPLGAIMGPYYTAENRPWYELNFELIL